LLIHITDGLQDLRRSSGKDKKICFQSKLHRDTPDTQFDLNSNRTLWHCAEALIDTVTKIRLSRILAMESMPLIVVVTRLTIDFTKVP